VLELRPARPDDAAAVAGVHVRSWQAGYRGLLPDAYLDGLRPEDRMGRYRFGDDDPGVAVTVVAVRDGNLCGFVTTKRPGPGAEPGPDGPDDGCDTGEVLALYVDPDAWGSGVGRQLLSDARLRLVQSGCTEAVLWVLAGNDRAHRFYRIDGWVAEDVRRTVEVWGIAVDEVRYRRPLP
jgi:ribosomal protein S18 acetylase RimI-like enzyme